MANKKITHYQKPGTVKMTVERPAGPPIPLHPIGARIEGPGGEVSRVVKHRYSYIWSNGVGADREYDDFDFAANYWAVNQDGEFTAIVETEVEAGWTFEDRFHWFASGAMETVGGLVYAPDGAWVYMGEVEARTQAHATVDKWMVDRSAPLTISDRAYSALVEALMRAIMRVENETGVSAPDHWAEVSADDIVLEWIQGPGREVRFATDSAPYRALVSAVAGALLGAKSRAHVI